MSRLLCALLSATVVLLAPGAAAQGKGRAKGGGTIEEIVSAKLEGRTISALVTRGSAATQPQHAIALFAGRPGILKLRMENGAITFDMEYNFAVRTRRAWLDPQTIAVTVDAPDDEWNGFSHGFRMTPRYAEDLRALLDAVEVRLGRLDWTAVGTSEGSVSAFHAGRMLPDRFRRVILTSSVFLPGPGGPGLTNVDWSLLKVPILWVHHADDPCRTTPYHEAVSHAKRTGAPLLTVRGGGPQRTGPCEAGSHHGFVGMERETVHAMRAWVQTGQVPESIGN